MLSAFAQMFRMPWFLFAFVVAILMVTAVVWKGDPYTIALDNMLSPPSADYLLGTDELGRDLLTRLMSGATLSVYVGFCVLMLAGVIGTVVGVVSGWFGGWVDMLLMRVTDIFLSFPGVLIAICFAALTAPDVKNVIFALGLMGWVSFARLARVQTMAVKKQEYIQAARLSGVSGFVIVLFYVLPNIAAPLVVESVFTIAGAMLSEAGLSFLGIGVQPPEASLGAMLREGARYMLMAPHLVVVPGVTLMLLVFTLNLVGDKLRDKLDKTNLQK